FNVNVSTAEKPNLFYSKYISSADYIEFERIIFEKGYYDGIGAFTDPNMKVISPVLEILNDQRHGVITKEQADSKINSFKNNDIRNDMLDYIYRNPLHQQYALSMAGGSNKTSHLLSLGYDYDLSSIKNTKNDRITFSSQNHFLLLPNLNFNAGITITAAQAVSDGTSIIPNSFIYQKLKDDVGNDLNIPQLRSKFEDTISNHGFLNWKYYPLQEPNYNNKLGKNSHARFASSVKYSLTKTIAAELNYQFEQSTGEQNSLARPESYQLRNKFNQFAILDGSGNYIGTNYPQGGLLNIVNSKLRSHDGRGTITYNEQLDDHRIIALAGFELRDIKTDVNGSRLYGYEEETGSFVYPDLFTSYPTFPVGSAYIDAKGNGIINTGTTNRYRSYFGNLSYTYLEKYVFTVSGRMDGSNYFGVNTNKKTVPLWSTGLKWDISKESFYSSNILPNLSLRATYGYSGNLAKNIAAITTFRYFPAEAQFTGLTYAGVNNIPNPDLRWEKTRQLNMGLDFSFASNKVTGSIDYYRKRGEDLIGYAQIDPTSGVTAATGNFSGMKSQGIDLLLNYKIIQRSLNWSGSFIFNYASEIITKWDVPPSASQLFFGFDQILPIVGKPLYSTYSYRWAGLDNVGNPMIILGDTVNKSFSPETINNLKISDLVNSGRYNPPVFGSLTNEFSWKNISLTMNLTYKLGHYFRRSSINYYNLLNTGWQASHTDFAERWQKPGDEIRTDVPALVYPIDFARESLYSQSEVLIEKADHVRIQYINLSYTLNKSEFRRLPFKTLQLYGYANNIGIIWRANNKGIDPEYPYLSFPPPRTFSVGARVSL
ncbi:MAG: TonB-dependent receptor, partial [Janthinobacterium sp.]